MEEMVEKQSRQPQSGGGDLVKSRRTTAGGRPEVCQPVGRTHISRRGAVASGGGKPSPRCRKTNGGCRSGRSPSCRRSPHGLSALEEEDEIDISSSSRRDSSGSTSTASTEASRVSMESAGVAPEQLEQKDQRIADLSSVSCLSSVSRTSSSRVSRTTVPATSAPA